MKYLSIVFTVCSMLFFSSCSNAQKTKEMNEEHKNNPYYSRTDTKKLNVSNAEWKKILSKDVYAVGREAETEWAFTGKYWKTDTKGMYYCAVCGNPLFRSDAKFARDRKSVV